MSKENTNILKVAFWLLTLVLFVAGLFLYGEPNQRESEFKQLKKIGAEYSAEYPLFEEFKLKIKDGYKAHFDAPKYDQVALGLEFMLREKRFPDLTLSVLAIIAKDRIEFRNMSIWYQSLIIGARNFIKLTKNDKNLLFAIQRKNTEDVEKIAATYGYKFFSIDDATRLVGYYTTPK